MSLPAEISTELDRAEAARAAGNEGRARVCARRAAGMAAREFLDRHEPGTIDSIQGSTRSGNIYEALLILAAYPGLASDLKQAVLHLTTRVSEEFSLPAEIDLIDEARKLIEGVI
jgi:hypothetical protein